MPPQQTDPVAAPFRSLTGTAWLLRRKLLRGRYGTNLFGFTVYDLAIDLPFLPAHPTFGLTGPHGRADSPPIEGTLTNGGASCTGGGRGALLCTSKGHSFSFGWSGTQIS
ncbi:MULTISPECIES: hypothetical protein [Nocardia]|uniref:Uncharacterized protein n=1 Tax=Nocardia implantans TaxID=3108168 RepID=A0ABU6AUJ7_9NOCA|nr:MULTISPECIES: hypothetical protein [unclassified Nocardia]MBF6192631.1 hypothetical protein [Nocardia beijingensis]MEA3527462.1 hypothetical protein [Nocardia sp. CDC192]MEB3511170.1 hypothetical protein [Nocardia sp. CDC186]